MTFRLSWILFCYCQKLTWGMFVPTFCEETCEVDALRHAWRTFMQTRHSWIWIKALMGDLFSFTVPVQIIPLLGQVFSLFSENLLCFIILFFFSFLSRGQCLTWVLVSCSHQPFWVHSLFSALLSQDISHWLATILGEAVIPQAVACYCNWHEIV